MGRALKRFVEQRKHRLRWMWSVIKAYRKLLRHAPYAARRGCPIGVHPAVSDYLRKSPGIGNLAREIYPGEELRIHPPQPLQEGVAVLEPILIKNPAANLYEFRDARFWGHYGGSVMASDNYLIEELSPDVLGVENHSVFSKWQFPKLRELKGTVAVLSTAEAANNYWHWTFDLVPRIHLLEKGGFTPQAVDHYLINHRNLPFQLRTFEEFGIPLNKIIPSDDLTHVRAEKLIVPSVKAGHLNVQTWACNFLKGRCPGKVNSLAKRRLFVGRGNSVFRRLLQEEEIFTALEPLGFKRISCDAMTQAEQMTVFNEAEFIVGAHGAALSNIVYCECGTTFIELFSPSYVDKSMWPAATIRGLRHFRFLGEPRQADEDTSGRKADLRFTLQQIRELTECVTALLGQKRAMSR